MEWSGSPPGTAAYALIALDMDVVRSGTPFTQWLLYNMPTSVTQLSAGLPLKPLLTNGAQQGLNDNGSVGYLPACPDAGGPPHHLTFTLFAQDGYVTLETGASPDSVQSALNGHIVGQATLTVIVKR